jgi:lactate dehydrogenase-like 2-hydroxyacid dehydrogenase
VNLARVSAERPIAVYTHAAPPVGMFLLRTICDVREGPERGRRREEIVRDARDAQALCVFVPDVIDDALLAQLPRLRVIAHFGKGYDNVDVASATRRRIWVTNVPADLTDATADLAWGLVLALARKIIPGDRAIREGLTPAWHPSRLLGTHVTGATLGIVGFGAIGRAIAKRARGFDCRILYYDVKRAPAEIERGLGVEYASFNDILREAEIVVPVVPALPETRNLFDAAVLARMRRTALLVNVARGSVVDEAAVANALRERQIGGYAADAFACEERIAERSRAYGLLAAHRHRGRERPRSARDRASGERPLGLPRRNASERRQRPLAARGGPNLRRLTRPTAAWYEHPRDPLLRDDDDDDHDG